MGKHLILTCNGLLLCQTFYELFIFIGKLLGTTLLRLINPQLESTQVLTCKLQTLSIKVHAESFDADIIDIMALIEHDYTITL